MEPYDWVDDENMSKEETMRRFQALNPQPSTGPPEDDDDEPGSGIRVADMTTNVTIENCRVVPKRVK